MTKVKWVVIILSSLFSIVSCSSYSHGIKSKKDITPYAFGLSKAKNGEDRFRVIYNAHMAAKAAGVNVDYTGINSIDLDIPKDAQSIPLTNLNDFSGVVFNVNNTNKDFFLFTYINEGTSIKVEKKDIDSGIYKRYPLLSKKRCLLAISDGNLWVERRNGRDYGHTRKDIVLIKKGKAVNTTIMPYNNASSSPICTLYPLSTNGIVLKTFILNRTADSNKKTFLCKIVGMDGVRINHVIINTPENHGQNDQAIVINDCTNVTFEQVTINGTYSRTDYSGYGIALDNIWNYSATGLEGKGNWGIFGNNNINTAKLEDCKINRFDVHCYGRDISFKRTFFFDCYNQFSSVYGTISFEKCEFDKFIPVLNELSYNAYVSGSIVFADCIFKPAAQRGYIIDMGRLRNDINLRPELTEKHWPDVTINNMTIEVPEGMKNVYLFLTRKDESFSNMSVSLGDIKINGMRFICLDDNQTVDFNLTNVDVDVDRIVNIGLENIYRSSSTKGPDVKIDGGKITSRFICPQNTRPIIKLTKSNFNASF